MDINRNIYQARDGLTFDNLYRRVYTPARAAFNYGTTGLGAYTTYRNWFTGQLEANEPFQQAKTLVEDVQYAYSSVVGETADEQMMAKEDKGTKPSKAEVQFSLPDTKKGVETQGKGAFVAPLNL